MKTGKSTPENKIFLDDRGIIASFSDYFRVKLLYKNGGWWVDMDIVCLKTFDFSSEYCFSSEYNQKEKYPNIGCIKCPPKSDIMFEYVDLLERYLESNQEVQWGLFGPRFMKAILSQYESTAYIHTPETFIMPKLICSDNKVLLFYNLFNVMDEGVIEKGLQDSYSIHLYNELWRLQGVDKFKPFEDGSPLDYLQKLYV